MELFPPFCYSHKDLAGKEPGFTSDNLWGEKKAFLHNLFDLAYLHIFYGFPIF